MVYHLLLLTNSEVTANGITETEMGQTLLNGNNIAMVCLPGLALSSRTIIRAEGWADGIVDSRRTGSKSIVGFIWIGSQLEIALVIKGDLEDHCHRTIKASHKKCMNTSSPRTKVDTNCHDTTSCSDLRLQYYDSTIQPKPKLEANLKYYSNDL